MSHVAVETTSGRLGGAGRMLSGSGDMLPLVRRRLSMRAKTGSRLAGLLSTAAVLLLPAMGIGTADALDVGEVVQLLVPDVSQFPADPETMDFICVAETEHAYWLVQDSTYLGTNPDAIEPDMIWGDYINQAQIDSLTAQFEGAGVDVYGTVTGLLGAVPDTDGDPKVWIVFADFPDYYQNSGGAPSTRVGRTVHVQPADIDGTGTFNNHDIFYVNAGLYETNQGVASKLRTWCIPTGLAMLIRTGVRPDEDLWLARGLGFVAQYECYGLTYTAIGPAKFGLEGSLMNFENSASIELPNAYSGLKSLDFSKNQGQELLWFMYLRQRVADDICYDIAQADTTGMQAVARAIDPTVPDSLAFDQLVFPIYEDWLITNVVNDLRSDYAGGIYRYDFLEGSSYQFTHAEQTSSFVGTFNAYPFGTFIADEAYPIAAPVFAAQYAKFLPDYSGAPAVYFNGMYSDGTGSGAAINGEWVGYLIQTDGTDITAVNQIDLSAANLYSGTFDLAGGGTNYMVVTNNNPQGQSELRFVLSQDTADRGVLVSFFQNLANPQYLDIYTSIYYTADSQPDGFDWWGPILQISHLTDGTPDSTAVIDMTAFSGTFWNKRFSAWAEGDFQVTMGGYDSLGRAVEATRELAVGYVETSGLVVDITEARVDVAPGAMAPGTCVMLAEADELSLSMASGAPVEAVVTAMEGIIEGPVMVGDVDGTISFPASGTRGSVYRWTNGAWAPVDSYFLGGRMCAPISEGGIYVFGTAPGVVSPELPTALTLAGTYPNPFSSEAVISFSLPTAGNASLRVYDMSGRIIRTIADGEMAAAAHSLVWDGRDDSGNTVAAGVYFCRLESSGQSAVQKMLRIAE